MGSSATAALRRGSGGGAAVLRRGNGPLDPDPRTLRGGDFGRRPESPTRHPAARCAAPWQRRGGRIPVHRQARGGLGCAERHPRCCAATWQQPRSRANACCDVATRARAHLRERVETRHPPACCLWPRSRHRPASAKAVSLRSSVMPANRECRSAATCAATWQRVCVPAFLVRRVRVASCGGGGSVGVF